MTAREYLDKCITALHLEVSGSVADEIRRAVDAALAEAAIAQTSSLIDRASAIAAGMVTDPTVWEDNSRTRLAASAVVIARQIEAAAADRAPTIPNVSSVVDNRTDNPVSCNFYLVKGVGNRHAWRAEFEVSDVALVAMRPRGDRDALLRLLIVDALSGVIEGKDLG